MENDTLRVDDVASAHEQAFEEDFGRSMESGKVPARMKQMRSNMADLQAEMLEMSESIQSYESSDVESQPLEESIPSEESLNAQDTLQDAPSEEDNKPGLLSRGLKRIASPIKKAHAFVQTAKRTYLQNQIDRQTFEVERRQRQLDKEQRLLAQEQARMEEELARQAEKEAARQATKEAIVNSGRSIRNNIQKGFQNVGAFARGVADKGRAIPKAFNRSVSDVKDGWNETKSFVSDVKERGREGVDNVKQAAAARRAPETDSSDAQVIKLMTGRLKEKHSERDSFNNVMKDVYDKNIGYDKLSPSSNNGTESLDQMAYLESKDYISQSPDGFAMEKNPSYYQHMLDLHSEDMLAESNGQLSDRDYEDRAKMLYEILLEEKGESQSKKELNETLLESYETSYPSKRLQIYLAKNPALTGIDEGLTEASVDKDDAPTNEYDLSTEDPNVHEADQYIADDLANDAVEVTRHQDINKEYNEVDLPNEGHVDLNQEEATLVHLADYRNEKDRSNSAVASGRITPDDESIVKSALRAEKNYTSKAITESKQPTVDIGDLSGPEGP